MTKKLIRRPRTQSEEIKIPEHPQIGRRLRDVPIQAGLPEVEVLANEIEGYVDVLLGRVPPPIEAGEMTLQEIADAYFARAAEIAMMIHRMEREGGTFKGSEYYRFRTGELRMFLEMSKRAAELGSRRLTQARLEFDRQLADEGLIWSDGS